MSEAIRPENVYRQATRPIAGTGMKCPVCSFETGHYVCSQAPMISLCDKLEKNNEMLLDVLKHGIVNCSECRVTKCCERCSISREAIAEVEATL